MRRLIVYLPLQLVFILSITNFLLAVEVSGIVTDQDGVSLPGANIMIEGTEIGSASDTEGRFSFTYDTDEEFVIVVSYIGYGSYRQTYESGDDLTDLTDSVDTSQLEDSVLDGYKLIYSKKTDEEDFDL